MSKFNLGDEVYYIYPEFMRLKDISIQKGIINTMRYCKELKIITYFFGEDDYGFLDDEIFYCKNDLIDSYLSELIKLRDL
jgi:hypothetical protein